MQFVGNEFWFTIQNVPIKFEDMKKNNPRRYHLQYKMFLLNNDTSLPPWKRGEYLQYKMFLLNGKTKYGIIEEEAIYNTKCSY